MSAPTRLVGPPWPGLAWAALPMIGCMAVLAWRGLGQVRSLAVAAARLVVQLLLLGAVLGFVFQSENPWVVGAVALVMLSASALTVGERQRRGRSAWLLRGEAFGALAIGAATTMAVGTHLVLGVHPWHDAATVVPMLGMVLGNSVNGLALAADRLDTELRANRDLIELRLALGATARQAAHEPLRAATRAALTPAIQGMSMAGIVSIPGMMTGQLLAGADVGAALRYQILIYLLIAGTVGISTLLLLALRLHRYFTPAHQLRPAPADETPAR